MKQLALEHKPKLIIGGASAYSREYNKKKFEELYNRSNSTKESIVELTTTIKMMVTQNEKNFADIKIKLDEVIKKSEGK